MVKDLLFHHGIHMITCRLQTLLSPVRRVFVHDALDKVPVAGVQLDLGAELHPADGRRVVPG